MWFWCDIIHDIHDVYNSCQYEASMKYSWKRDLRPEFWWLFFDALLRFISLEMDLVLTSKAVFDVLLAEFDLKLKWRDI